MVSLTDIAELEEEVEYYVDMDSIDWFGSYDDFLDTVKEKFDKNYSSGIEKASSNIFDKRQAESKKLREQEEQFLKRMEEEEKLPSTLEKIKQIMKEKLTKREQTKQVIETTSKSFTVKEFVELTGMNYNTARRELGQGVKNGQFERISRGIYRRL